MAYTLKNATIPNKIRWIIAVDPADGVVKHYAPIDSTSRAGYAVTQGANVTIGAQAWNGNTRSYFVNGTGTADADFVKFDTNKPSYNPGNTGEEYTLLWCGENVSSGQPLCAFGYDSTHYMATFDMGAGGNTYPCLMRSGTALNPGQAYPGANQKLLFGFHLTMGTSLYALYGSDSGAPTKSSSLGAPGNATSTDLDLNYVSRRNDSPNDHPFKTHFVLQTNSILSDAEVDALRVDWFTELFETTSDTTAPTLTSPTGTGGTLTCSGSVSTNEANGTLYCVFTASATSPSAAQVKLGQDHTGAAALRATSQAVSSTGVQSIGSGAITAGTRYAHFMHEDAATNQSTVATSSSFVVASGADTDPPTMNGSITVSNISTTSYTLSWSAASDNVGVTGYEVSVNGGTNYTDVGNVLTYGITGRTPGATDAVRVRAYDAGLNYATPLSTSVGLATSTVVTSIVSNGAGTPLGNTLFHYTYWPSGRIGSMTAVSPVEGTVTSGSNGVVTISNLPLGSGVLMLAYRAATGQSDETTDKVYYQAVSPS